MKYQLRSGRKSNQEKRIPKYRSFAYITPKGYTICRVDKKKERIYLKPK